jgi:hypothetical protein
MGYVGNQQAEGFVQRPTKQDLTGATGDTLTLTHAVSKEEDIDLYINNVKQEPTTAYTVADTAVTLTGDVVASDDIYVVYNSLALQTVVPPDGSVTTAKLASGSVTSAKLAGLTSSDMPTGSVLQVVQGETTAQTTFQTASWVDSGLSATITPKFSNSKILVNVVINWGMAELGRNFSSRLLRDTTPIGNGTGTTTRQAFAHTEMSVVGYQYLIIPHTVNFLDSPATTSAITYKTQVIQNATGANIYLNRSHDNTSAQANTRSTITLTEIAG